MTLLRKFELESERHTQFSTEPFVLNFAPEVDIAAGGLHSTALTNDGDVFPSNSEEILLIVIAMSLYLYYHSFIRLAEATMGLVVIPRRCPKTSHHQKISAGVKLMDVGAQSLLLLKHSFFVFLLTNKITACAKQDN